MRRYHNPVDMGCHRRTHAETFHDSPCLRIFWFAGAMVDPRWASSASFARGAHLLVSATFCEDSSTGTHNRLRCENARPSRPEYTESGPRWRTWESHKFDTLACRRRPSLARWVTRCPTEWATSAGHREPSLRKVSSRLATEAEPSLVIGAYCGTRRSAQAHRAGDSRR